MALAILASSMSGRVTDRARAAVELESQVSPVAAAAPFGRPRNGVDLRLRFPAQKFDLKSLIPKKPPLEVKGMKVVGASGVGIFAPITDEVAAGVGVTAFKIQPGKRATQVVLGLKFKF